MFFHSSLRFYVADFNDGRNISSTSKWYLFQIDLSLCRADLGGQLTERGCLPGTNVEPAWVLRQFIAVGCDRKSFDGLVSLADCPNGLDISLACMLLDPEGMRKDCEPIDFAN